MKKFDQRIVILTDIHGNSIALDAVLDDIEARVSPDAYWILGDIAALGHDPVGVIERLQALPNVHFCRGNTDRYVCTGDRPPPSMGEAKVDPDLLPILREVAATFAWTQGMVTAAGHFDWLAQLTLEIRTTLPGGKRVLGVHASPKSDEAGIMPSMRPDQIAALVDDCAADLIFVGHTHISMDITVGDLRIINPSSVSNPLPPDLRAGYAILQASPGGFEAQQHYVEYDREAVIVALSAINHPGREFITRHMRGRVLPGHD